MKNKHLGKIPIGFISSEPNEKGMLGFRHKHLTSIAKNKEYSTRLATGIISYLLLAASGGRVRLNVPIWLGMCSAIFL